MRLYAFSGIKLFLTRIRSLMKSEQCVDNAKNEQVILQNRANSTSFFEFWPTWVMYIPVVIQWLILSIKHRSLTLPLLANPKLTLSGMVGVPKSELMATANGQCKSAILVWDQHITSNLPAEEQAVLWLSIINKKGIYFPFVCKPDIGCRGSGVKLVHNFNEFVAVIDSYPENSLLLSQKLSSWEPEAGVFFVKLPGQAIGEIASLT